MKNTNKTAKLLEVIARKSAVSTANTRCMYLFHQPKHPTGIKNLKKN